MRRQIGVEVSEVEDEHIDEEDSPLT